ncbi:aldehyde dehydrogenase family protein [Actibacterium sp. 188UL27-1]|uniref:aldehyde dehydrogenase family protein n=1 Tax=Actibacterium sp. 188UL27-1 TaxID=2786961 RepID=UPI00195B6FDC|nr:aldehyde dehydrogenase family protein [Actibacterium sp. 188UL27-1]MBM7067451.1 aldehyde dehydrogenase family protein [Actibacterium sp. 188UL27-1]
MIRCISPIDGSVYAERPTMSHDDALTAITRAQAAQMAWALTPLETRIDLVLKGIENLGATNDEIVPELAWQMGRPIRYGGEFGGVNERASYMAKVASEALAPMQIENSNNFHRMIKRVPKGVVLVIAPWNYPYMTAINTVAPALIAGNSVILKHASQTPLVGERIARAFHEAGIGEDIFRNVFWDHDLTRDMIRARPLDDQVIRHVNFTGSVAGGQAMEQAAAGTFASLGLELGGKDPGYVMQDADLDAAVDSLIDGAMFNSGQCCCGIERIYVTEPLFDDFVAKAVEIVNGYILGNPLDAETTLGPMAQPRFADLVRQQTADAIAAGAKSHIDPARFPNDGGAYLMPQILTGVTHDMDLMRVENFGPVVGIMPVKTEGEAIDLMNDSPYGLTASLWTQDPGRAERIGDQLDTGTVFMNRCDYLDPALCWTGCKDTGKGEGLSVLGYHAVTRPKSYHLKKG